MEIRNPTIQRITKLVTEQMQPLYDKLILPNSEIDFSRFLQSVLASVLEDIQGFTEAKNRLILITKHRNVTKKRWFDDALNPSNKGYFYEVEIVAKGVYHLKPEKFSLIFEGFSTYKEYKDFRLQELKNWLRDKDIPVCAFPHTVDKPLNTIQNVMRDDLMYIILKELVDPRVIHPRLAAHYQGSKVYDIDEKHYMETHYNSNVYYIEDEQYLTSQPNYEELKQLVVRNIPSTLKFDDRRVFLHCMSCRNIDFFTKREISIDMDNIVQHVFSSASSSNYVQLRESLDRIGYITIHVHDKFFRGFTMRIFDNVTIDKSIDDREIVKLTVNSYIVNQFIKKQTTDMYQDIIAQFKLDSSRLAIFPLQLQRLLGWFTGRPRESFYVDTSYNFFKGVFWFSNHTTKKNKNHHTIECALSEIVESGIILKSYVRKGDKYALGFYPLSNQEIKDLLGIPITSIFDIPYQQDTLG